MLESDAFILMEPPPADRELNADLVRQVLADQFPSLGLQTVDYLASGWEHDAYLVDERVVLRFPRYREVADGLERDGAILELVSSAVGSAATIPQITLWGSPSKHFPHHFFGHEAIPGVDANPLVHPSNDLAADLGVALSRVHAITSVAAASAGVGSAKDDCSIDLLVDQATTVGGLRALVPEAFAWLAARPEAPVFEGSPRFVHNDLQPEHIITDAGSGRLSGVIDWSGAGLGDPTVDFAFLLLLGGRSFLGAALTEYRLPVDDRFVDRVLFRARVRALGWLVHALHVDLDTTRSLTEVCNAFAEWPAS